MSNDDPGFTGSFAGEEPASVPVSPPRPVYQRRKPPNPRNFVIVMSCVTAVFLVSGVLLILTARGQSIGLFLIVLGAVSIGAIFRVRSQRR